MSRIKVGLSFVALLLLAVVSVTVPLAPLRAQQTPPALLVLEHDEAGKTIETPVPARAGPASSPLQGKVLKKITIRPGSTLLLAVQPLDVMVELYRGASFGGDLVCSIRIRYFRNRDGAFVPHYQLSRDPLVFRTPAGRWIPIEPACGAPSAVAPSQLAAANSDGFYAALEFGAVSGLLQIDSWIVR